MASLKFPDISVSAIEAGMAMKKLSDTLAKTSEAMAKVRELEPKNLIFKVQVVSVFPTWYLFGSMLEGPITVEEETIKTNCTFTSEIYVRESIKQTLAGIEEKQKTNYQTLLKMKYKDLPTREISPETHYMLEVLNNDDRRLHEFSF